jgi:hypothetical protein
MPHQGVFSTTCPDLFSRLCIFPHAWFFFFISMQAAEFATDSLSFPNISYSDSLIFRFPPLPLFLRVSKVFVFPDLFLIRVIRVYPW